MHMCVLCLHLSFLHLSYVTLMNNRKLPSYLHIGLHVMNKTFLPIKNRYNLVAQAPACADNISGSQFMINKNHQRQDYLLVTR